MSEQDNIKIAQASFAAINAHDLDKWSSFQADDYMADNSAGPGTMNKEQTRMLQQGFQTALRSGQGMWNRFLDKLERAAEQAALGLRLLLDFHIEDFHIRNTITLRNIKTFFGERYVLG